MNHQPVLLIEDNDADVLLMREAFKQNNISTPLVAVEDGVKALEYLNLHKSNAKPLLILVDLNVPKKDGREILQEIKKDENFKRIPVIVLTSSQADSDILTTYNLHANCYVLKPNLYPELVGLVSSIKDFWLSKVKLPPS